MKYSLFLGCMATLTTSVSAFNFGRLGGMCDLQSMKAPSTEQHHPSSPALPSNRLVTRDDDDAGRWETQTLMPPSKLAWAWKVPHELLRNKDDTITDFYITAMKAATKEALERTRDQQKERAIHIGLAGKYLGGQARVINELVANRSIKLFETLEDLYSMETMALLGNYGLASWQHEDITAIDLHTPVQFERDQFSSTMADPDNGLWRLLQVLEGTTVKNDTFWAPQCGVGPPEHCNDEQPGIRATQWALFGVVTFMQQHRALCEIGKALFWDCENGSDQGRGGTNYPAWEYFHSLYIPDKNKVLKMDQY